MNWRKRALLISIILYMILVITNYFLKIKALEIVNSLENGILERLSYNPKIYEKNLTEIIEFADDKCREIYQNIVLPSIVNDSVNRDLLISRCGNYCKNVEIGGYWITINTYDGPFNFYFEKNFTYTSRVRNNCIVTFANKGMYYNYLLVNRTLGKMKKKLVSPSASIFNPFAGSDMGFVILMVPPFLGEAWVTNRGIGDAYVTLVREYLENSSKNIDECALKFEEQICNFNKNESRRVKIPKIPAQYYPEFGLEKALFEYKYLVDEEFRNFEDACRRKDYKRAMRFAGSLGHNLKLPRISNITC